MPERSRQEKNTKKVGLKIEDPLGLQTIKPFATRIAGEMITVQTGTSPDLLEAAGTAAFLNENLVNELKRGGIPIIIKQSSDGSLIFKPFYTKDKLLELFRDAGVDPDKVDKKWLNILYPEE